MNEIKGTLFLLGFITAGLLIGYMVRRIEKKHQQPLDSIQIKNLELMAKDMRKTKDDIAQ